MTRWSPARSSLLHHCPRQYALRYVLKAVPAQPDSVARMRGRVIHAGLAAAFQARAAGEMGAAQYPLMARYYPAAEAAMLAHADAAVLSSVERAGAFAQAHRVLRRVASPHPAAILGVEMPFDVDIEEVPVEGVIDLALRTGLASVHVREWKTGTVTWLPLEDDALPVYGWAAAQRWPWVKTITVGLYATRVNQEREQALSVARSRLRCAKLARDARWAATARTSLTAETIDALYPMNPGGHCGGCPFRSYCPQFSKVSDLPLRSGVDVAAERHRLAQTLEHSR
jgi:hypothetical protein